MAAAVVDDIRKDTLVGFIDKHTKPGATVYSDEAAAYNDIVNHEAVRHGVGELCSCLLRSRPPK